MVAIDGLLGRARWGVKSGKWRVGELLASVEENG